MPKLLAEKLLASAATILACASPCSATWQTFTSADGLASNTVGSSFEDRAGGLWFGTSAGFSRYDGVTWTTFHPEVDPATSLYWQALEDRQGRIWFWGLSGRFSSPRNQAAWFDGITVRPLSQAVGLLANGVSAIVEDTSGAIWVASPDSGVSRHDASGWHGHTVADGLADDHVTAMLADRGGGVWLASPASGVSRFDGTSWKIFTTTDGLASNSVQVMVQDRQGALWFGTSDGGASRFDGSAWQTFTPFDVGVSSNVSWIVEDSTGGVWMPGDSGVVRFDGASWLRFPEIGTSARTAFVDRSGAVWIVVDDLGIYPYRLELRRYDGSRWRTFTQQDSIFECGIYSYGLSRDGGVWVGRRNGGVSAFNGSDWRTWGTNPCSGEEYGVRSILEDRLGNLWFTGDIGGATGVTRFDRAEIQSQVRAPAYPFPISIVYDDPHDNLWFESLPNLLLIYRGAGDSAGVSVPWDTLQVPDHDQDVGEILQDRNGITWVARPYHHAPPASMGVSRWNGATWTPFGTSDGLGENCVRAILEDHLGRLWFGCCSGGLTVVDAGGPRTFTTADGLVGNSIQALAEDHLGRIWIAANPGVSVYDGSHFTSYTVAEGLVDPQVRSLLVDRDDRLWFGTTSGLSRFDGSSWKTYLPADGLSDDRIYSMFEDSRGHLWFGTGFGLSEFDGRHWRTFTQADGLASNFGIESIVGDRHGDLWLATPAGTSRLSPDRVPPRAVFVSAPPSVSSSRTQSAVFLAAFGEGVVEFSFAFDGGPWSPFTTVNQWLEQGLEDGLHRLAVRARDVTGNIDPAPPAIAFEIDATAPSPLLTVPVQRQAERDSFAIMGTVTDARFREYRLEIRPASESPWDSGQATLLGRSSTAVTRSPLAGLDTRRFPDGEYDLRLSVTDTLGLEGSARVTFVIDNQPPFAAQTSPATVSAASGGDVYTTRAEAHLYVPPHGLDRDAEVRIDGVPADSIPVSLPGGALRVAGGFELSFGLAALTRAATLDIAAADSGGPTGTRALYRREGDEWARVGGTPEAGARLAASITRPGRYAVFAETSPPSGAGILSAIVLTPRIFSPHGRYASAELAIGFNLARASTATIKIYNRAGRLVRDLASGSFGPGANLVRWDGRDGSGDIVSDGMYLVAVDALGQRKIQTLAVVR